MTRLRHTRRRAAAAVAVAVLVTVTACTDDGEVGSAPTGAPSPVPSTSATSRAATGSVPFGDCPNLPDDGDGSLLDLSNRDWIDAIAQIPALSQFRVTTALAGLGQDFSGVREATVFTPTDAGFRALGADRGRELLTHPAQAADVLRYHVVSGLISPDGLPGEHRTLNGQTLTVTGSGEDFTVNGQARIVCGNLQTKNATLYLIDRVLQPS